MPILTTVDLTGADLSYANLSNASYDLNGQPPIVVNVIYFHTICPDGTDSILYSNTCSGHGMP